MTGVKDFPPPCRQAYTPAPADPGLIAYRLAVKTGPGADASRLNSPPGTGFNRDAPGPGECMRVKHGM